MKKLKIIWFILSGKKKFNVVYPEDQGFSQKMSYSDAIRTVEFFGGAIVFDVFSQVSDEEATSEDKIRYNCRM